MVILKLLTTDHPNAVLTIESTVLHSRSLRSKCCLHVELCEILFFKCCLLPETVFEVPDGVLWKF